MHLALINAAGLSFNASGSNAAGLSFNAGVVSTLAKNEKTWVLRLCPSKLCFVISERGPVGGANIWCELSQVCLTSHTNCTDTNHTPSLASHTLWREEGSGHTANCQV